MKSLSELADVYEKWATANEASAEQILSRLDSLPGEAQQQQRWRASQVMAEAAALKKRAGELRKLEGGTIDVIQDGYKVPHRDQRCDDPQGISRYKRFP